jgi:hypothetical protein
LLGPGSGVENGVGAVALEEAVDVEAIVIIKPAICPLALIAKASVKMAPGGSRVV